jgi:hypothetical protein
MKSAANCFPKARQDGREKDGFAGHRSANRLAKTVTNRQIWPR